MLMGLMGLHICGENCILIQKKDLEVCDHISLDERVQVCIKFSLFFVL